MDSVKLRAMAKINLALDVLNKRVDGYHEVDMIMQSINIYDDISIERIVHDDIEVMHNVKDDSITEDYPQLDRHTIVSINDKLMLYILSCNYKLDIDDDNTMVKAVRLFSNKYDIRGRIRIDFRKNIPIAAGLGGGSADAAAVLVGLNRMYGINASMGELKDIGLQIGADVPFCIEGGCMRATGVGELLVNVTNDLDYNLLVIKPCVDIATRDIYESLSVNSIDNRPCIENMINAMSNADEDKFIHSMGNVLEPVAIERHPEVLEIKTLMGMLGAKASMMSGSGSTVYGLYDSKISALQALEKIEHISKVEFGAVTRFVDVGVLEL